MSTDRVTLKSRGQAIFDQELAKRANGTYETNKSFRAVVLARMVAEVDVSTASASAMFNQSKQLAEAADPNIGLGRDPKKVTVKVSAPVVVETVSTEAESEPEMETEDEVTA